MHPIPSLLPKRALHGLGGLLLGSLLLLGPAQVSADHDLTCHQPLPTGGGGGGTRIGLINAFATLDTLPILVSLATPRDDRTGEEVKSRPRTIQSPSDQDGPTTPVVTRAGAPAEARSC
jgi:hypothetical protein